MSASQLRPGNAGCAQKMDDASIVVRLPYLRELPDYGDCGPVLGLLRLWPGLPEMPAEGWHLPENFPLAPRLARRFLEELETYGAEELANLQIGHLLPENSSRARNMAEMAELARFARAEAERPAIENSQKRDVLSAQPAAMGEKPDALRPINAADDLALLQAHKILLWVWLAQGRLAEIAALARDFSKAATDFSTIMAEGEDVPPPPLERLIAIDESLAPPWQVVLLNALPFLAKDVAIFAEGAMRRDLQELAGWEEMDLRGIKVRGGSFRVGELPGMRKNAHDERLIRVVIPI